MFTLLGSCRIVMPIFCKFRMICFLSSGIIAWWRSFCKLSSVIPRFHFWIKIYKIIIFSNPNVGLLPFLWSRNSMMSLNLSSILISLSSNKGTMFFMWSLIFSPAESAPIAKFCSTSHNCFILALNILTQSSAKLRCNA